MSAGMLAAPGKDKTEGGKFSQPRERNATCPTKHERRTHEYTRDERPTKVSS